MTILLPLAAFLLLAAGTHRPSQILFGHLPSRRRRIGLLACGYALLLLSLGLALHGADAGRQAVEWFGDLTVAALGAVGMVWLIARQRAG